MELNGFIGPSYTVQSTAIECQRTLNLFPQIDESGVGRNVAALIATPGLKLFSNTGIDPSRGMITTSTGRVFAVAGTGVYEIFLAGGRSLIRGNLLTKVGRVGIADNGQQLMIVDGPYGYTYDLATDTLTQITGFFPGGATIAFQDGYFIFNQPNAQTFYITGLFSTTIDPLDFASAESNPDNLLCVLSIHRELWLFGAESLEVWFNSGAELFPFSEIQGSEINRGTVAPYSVVALDNTIYWLGQDDSGLGMIWKASGYQPSRVSTFAIEQVIARYPKINDATAFAYQMDGHTFYQISFPSANDGAGATWVYDAATQLWHERGYTLSTGFIGRHRAETHTVGFGLHLVGDWQNGNIYQLDPLTLNDNGNPITKQRTSPYVAKELVNMFFAKLQLDMETGLQQDGNAPVPQAVLDWSDDGGASWSNQHSVSLGKIGQKKARAIWRRLGSSRERVFRVTITDDCQVSMIDAYIDVEPGTS